MPRWRHSSTCISALKLVFHEFELSGVGEVGDRKTDLKTDCRPSSGRPPAVRRPAGTDRKRPSELRSGSAFRRLRGCDRRTCGHAYEPVNVCAMSLLVTLRGPTISALAHERPEIDLRARLPPRYRRPMRADRLKDFASGKAGAPAEPGTVRIRRNRRTGGQPIIEARPSLRPSRKQPSFYRLLPWSRLP